MNMEFTATSSFAYQFAKSEVLPLVDVMPEVTCGQPFRLKDLSFKVVDDKLTSEQRQMLVGQSEGKTTPMRSLIRFWALTIATSTQRYVPLGKGMFRKETEQDFDESAVIDAAFDDDEDVEMDEFGGSVYAFTFPSIFKHDQPSPIKVGKTVGDVQKRVFDQCKCSAAFEQPQILGAWQVKRVGPTELAIHNVLTARGKWREDAPGKEWFDTTIIEVEAILKFVDDGM
jgi:hypothetical protein